MNIHPTIAYQLTTALSMGEVKRIISKQYRDPSFIVNCYSDYLTVSKNDALIYKLDREEKKCFWDLFFSLSQREAGCLIKVENKPSFWTNASSFFMALILLGFDYGSFYDLYERHYLNWTIFIPFIIMAFGYLIISSVFKMAVAKNQNHLIWILEAQLISDQEP